MNAEYAAMAVSLLLSVLFLEGCHRSVSAPETIRDLRELKQDCTAYLDCAGAQERLVPADRQQRLYDHFRKTFFGPWHNQAAGLTAQDAASAFERFTRDPGFGQNMRKNSASWVESLRQQAQLERFPDCVGKAITIRNSNLRELPTFQPRFDDFAQPGGGYPFDMLQASSVYAGAPLRVYHASRDGSWLMVRTSLGDGWIPAEDVAWVDDEFIRTWENAPLAGIVKDGVAVRDSSARFCFKVGIGAVFPLAQRAGGPAAVLIAVRGSDGKAAAVSATVPDEAAAPMPLAMTARNAARIANEMLGEPYGWGGMYGSRDCSSTIRDLLAPFGLWLPRNSAAQARAGVVIPLKDLPADQKERTIIEKARPYLALINAPGHVALYIGRSKGRAIILQNFWGMKVRQADGREGRYVVGQCAITTLQPGIELPNLMPEGDLRNRVESMTILFQSDGAGQ